MTSPGTIRRGTALLNASLKKLRMYPESAFLFFPQQQIIINLNIFGRCWFLTCTLSPQRATVFYSEHDNFSSSSSWNPGLLMEFRVWILNYFSVLHGFLNGNRYQLPTLVSQLKRPYLPPDLTGAACSEIITLEQNQGVCGDWLFPPIYQKDQGRILGIALMLHKLGISPDPWKLGGKALTSGHGSPEADSTYIFPVSSPNCVSGFIGF